MSGAKNCPETPRQKMIGMMYLVLTAMLALNVSSVILDGFTMVDDSLHSTIESSDARNKALYEDFQYLNKENPKKIGEWLQKATLVKQKSDELYKYIEDFKYAIVKIADKDKADPKVRVIEGRDNLDAAGQYAILNGKGKELKKKIDEYRNMLTEMTKGDPKKQALYEKIFNTGKIYSQHNKEKTDWNIALFEMMPVSAVVTIMTKYQSDVRASESEMIQFLKAQTDASDFRVNKIDAMVVPNSKFVFKGQKYSAKIVLSAVDSTKTPEYYVNGSRLANNTYEFVAGSKMGQSKYSGEIRLPGNDGVVRSYKFESDYIVSEPSANVSNEDLNVVYKGIDNNISVSVPGVTPENVRVVVSGGTAQNLGRGKYIVRTFNDGVLKLAIYGKMDNKELSMGEQVFRIKRLSRPAVYIVDAGGEERQDNMTLDQLRGSSIIASYGPDALIDVKFKIISFSMSAPGLRPVNINGTRMDVNFINNLSKGNMVILYNIKAVGPDKIVQSLSSVAIRVI